MAEVVLEVRTIGTRKTRAAALKAPEENQKREKRKKGANTPSLVGLLKDNEINDDLTYFRRMGISGRRLARK